MTTLTAERFNRTAYRETTRERALAALERRLRILAPDQLVYRPPIVSMLGRCA